MSCKHHQQDRKLKNVHFTFHNVIKVKNDGVAMGSPLGQVLSDTFMIESET